MTAIKEIIESIEKLFEKKQDIKLLKIPDYHIKLCKI